MTSLTVCRSPANEQMLAAIVAIEIAVTRLLGKWETSQNRPAIDREGWSVLRVPSIEDEDARRLHGELARLKREGLAHRCRSRRSNSSLGLVPLDQKNEQRLCKRVHQPGEDGQPDKQRYVDKIAWDYVQEIQLHRTGHLECTNRVHALRENRSPI